MADPVIIAIPSKGRLMEKAEDLFAGAGFTIERIGDALDGLLALLDRVDEELAGAHFFLNVLLLLFAESALGDHLLVSG